ncbi:peptidoglycan DD-metalloendopeptidase family protein [Streptomyces sp. MMBL 11-3]|uniref:peptidoglycan DD-metalloendopeptidase family protein n=1 Tax=Streptomyces sp. MMBL 11-3 TaxID=3382639 RepID=UPI0039B6B4EC
MRADRFLRTPSAPPRALAPAAVLVLGLLLSLIPSGPAATARDGGPGSMSDGASGGGGPSGASAGGGPGSTSAGGGSAGGAGPAVPAVGRVWPVGSRPPVARGWEPPATAYGRGHRGLDLTAAPGTPVRSVASGRVSFAGRVAGRAVVSVELTGTGTPPLRTTYAPVRATLEKGAEVTAGEVVGVLEPPDPHCPASCLHWGLRRGDTYLDPLTLLPPWLLARGPSRLLPITGVPEPGQPASRAAPAGELPRRVSPGRRAGPSRPRPR